MNPYNRSSSLIPFSSALILFSCRLNLSVHQHPMNDHRLVFSGKTVCGVFWPWSPFANPRRRIGVRGFTMSEHLLHLERQFSRRCKQEGKNW
jgi:hypothetical protein